MNNCEFSGKNYYYSCSPNRGLYWVFLKFDMLVKEHTVPVALRRSVPLGVQFGWVRFQLISYFDIKYLFAHIFCHQKLKFGNKITIFGRHMFSIC